MALSFEWDERKAEVIKFALLLRGQPAMSENNMKKQPKKKAGSSHEMRAEYDFGRSVRGKHATRYAAGTNVVVLEPDVASQFPTADDVNDTLRAVAKLIERRKRPGKHQPA